MPPVKKERPKTERGAFQRFNNVLKQDVDPDPLEHIANIFETFNALEKIADDIGAGKSDGSPAAFLAYLIRSDRFKLQAAVCERHDIRFTGATSKEVSLTWKDPENPAKRKGASVKIRFFETTEKE